MGQKMEQGQERTDLSGPEFKTLKAKGERQKLLTKKSEYESIQCEKKWQKKEECWGQKILAQEPVEPLHQLLPATLQGSPHTPAS